MSLLDRFPILIWAGGALLGWVAGEVIATDPVTTGLIAKNFGAAVAHNIEYAAAVVGAIFVVTAGWLWRRCARGLQGAGGVGSAGFRRRASSRGTNQRRDQGSGVAGVAIDVAPPVDDAHVPAATSRSAIG